jgi:pyruvate formate lyase activating enzyme
MASPDFTEALVLRLREEGIHTAIETTGCVGEEVFHRLAPLFDLLLFDVKHYDPEKHRKGTGAGTELIHRNLRWAGDRGLNILPGSL